MKKYYVYALLDPRKPGKFKYGNLTFKHLPFYIGKGSKNRMTDHNVCDISNSFKCRTISKILKAGFNYIPIKLRENLTESEAFKFEVRCIKIIGRQECGPLTNLTDGGEGFKLTKKQLIKRGKSISKAVKNINRYWLKGTNNYKYKRLNLTVLDEENIVNLYVNARMSLQSIKTFLENDGLILGKGVISSILRRRNVILRNNTLESRGARTKDHIKKVNESRKWYCEKITETSKWFLKKKILLKDVKKLIDAGISTHEIVSILKFKYKKMFAKRNVKFDYNRVYKIKNFLKNGR